MNLLRPEALSLEGPSLCYLTLPTLVLLNAYKPLLSALQTILVCLLPDYSVHPARSRCGLVSGILKGSSLSVWRPMLGGQSRTCGGAGWWFI